MMKRSTTGSGTSGDALPPRSGTYVYLRTYRSSSGSIADTVATVIMVFILVYNGLAIYLLLSMKQDPFSDPLLFGR